MKNDDLTCRYCDLSSSKFENIRNKLREDLSLLNLADFFKVFGDSTRVKIIFILAESELCVMDLARLLDMEQSAVSHQLRTLKQARFVKHRREGKVIYYSLYDEHLKEIFLQGLEHVRER